MLVAQSCPALCDPMDYMPARLLCPWNSPDKNTGVGCHSLLQGIFPSQESNSGLLHCRQILYHLIHQGNPIFKLDDAKLLSHLLQEYLFSLPEISFVTTATTSGMHYSLFNFIVRPFTVSIFTILLPYKVTKTQMVLPS